MNKVITSILLGCFLLFSIPIQYVNAASSDTPSRMINIVYDDSGSMIEDNGYVDRWCKAKYAMEVFSSMLGEKDVMNVYVMSDFVSNDNASPKLVLNGKDGAQKNVERVHNMLTNASSTPFGTVRKAYSDLAKAKADEKWLVVLTDGVFHNLSGTLDAFFGSKADDVSVMYLGMGSEAKAIKEDPQNNIFYAKAENSSDILHRVSEICSRIFESDKLDVNINTRKISFDIPMSELVVFAQGANVSINSIKDADGKEYKSATAPVVVKYCETAAYNYKDDKNVIVDKSLSGAIATFKEDFNSGEYTLDVNGAETIEVYYKPNVDLGVFLMNQEGQDVSEKDALENGEYKLEYAFIKAGTRERLPDSKLLGKPDFKGYLIRNGSEKKETIKSGDTIKLDVGEAKIVVSTRYLQYNEIQTEKSFNVFSNKSIAFKLENNPSIDVGTNGFSSSGPIQISASIDGQPITPEVWDQLGVPEIESLADESLKIKEIQVAKSGQVGIYEVTPVLDGEPAGTEYADFNYRLSFSELHGEEIWSGNAEFTAKVNETRPWWEIHKDLVRLMIIGLIILLILLGYLPIFKHYFPKSMKKRPAIQCTPDSFEEEPRTDSGVLKKDIFSTLIPYIPQTGTLIYLPLNARVLPPLKLRALKNRRMAVVNFRSFVDNENIKINNKIVEETDRKLEINSSATIIFTRNGWEYKCIPSKEK